MKSFSVYLSILMTFLILSCKGSQDALSYSKEVASEKLGLECECSLSESESYTLCLSNKKDASQSGMGVDFFVMDNDSKEIVFEESIDRGTVSWEGDKKIAMFYTPGVMRVDQSRDDFTYVYDLVSKEKIRKGQLKSN
ncbi:MAG: hypothetical protein AB8B73_04345 [Ekhidna sp.]